MSLTRRGGCGGNTGLLTPSIGGGVFLSRWHTSALAFKSSHLEESTQGTPWTRRQRQVQSPPPPPPPPRANFVTGTLLHLNGVAYCEDARPQQEEEEREGGTEIAADKTIPTNRYETICFLKDLLETHPVVVFMKGTPAAPKCGHSLRMTRALEATGLKSFITVDVTQSQLLMDTLKELSLCPTFPQLFIRSNFIGDADKTTEKLKDGSLKILLN